MISIRDKDKSGICDIVSRLYAAGFTVIATRGTAKFLNEKGHDVEMINKVTEGRPHIVDLIKNREVAFVINTVSGAQAQKDSLSIRRSALQYGVPYTTNMGLGWILGHFEGLKTVSHGGGGFGSTCFLVLLPEREMAAIILCNEESSGHTAAVKAVMRTMLDLEPEAGAVSWMVPITKALQAGGIQAAQTCYDQLKNNDRA